MPVVTSDLLSTALTGVRALFREEFPAAMEQQLWRQLVMTTDSRGKKSMDYSWLGQVPTMQEFKGEVELGDLASYNFSLENTLYTAAFGVQRLALERDELQQIDPRTRQLVLEAARYPGELLFDKIVSGTSDTAFDGTAFFADTRTIGDSANIDNLLAGAGTTAANIRTDIGAAETAMARFEDDKGRPIGRTPNVFLIPIDLNDAFYEALNVGSGSDDPPISPATESGMKTWSAKGYTVVTTPYFSDTDDWYALHVSGDMLAPFVYQVEGEPEIEGITEPNSESGVIFERFIYKVRMKFAVGYTDPRFAVKVVN